MLLVKLANLRVCLASFRPQMQLLWLPKHSQGMLCAFVGDCFRDYAGIIDAALVLFVSGSVLVQRFLWGPLTCLFHVVIGTERERERERKRERASSTTTKSPAIVDT